MRRIVLWALSTFSVVMLLFGYSTSTSGPTVGSTQPAIVSETSAGTSSGPPSSSSPGAAPTSGSSRTTTTSTGEVAQTRYGPIQVKLTTSGTSITQVAVVQYPHDSGEDKQINGYALPILVQETMQAQSASIDMVSGATYTSDGYLQSLQSALDRTGA